MDERVTYDSANGVAVLMLNRAVRRNAIDRWMLQSLIGALRRANEDPQARVLALTGHGRGFCAGLDLDESRSLGNEASEDYARTCGQLLLRAAGAVRKPIIVAAHGVCSGLGASLALACDMRVMSDDTVLDPGPADGSWVPEAGMSWFLTRHLGYGRAFDIIARHDRLTAMRCLELGLASDVLPRETLMAETMRIATTLAAQPAHALIHAKSALRDAIGISLMDAVANDAHLRRLEREAGELPRLSQPASTGQSMARV
jgi:2-(1,2-epoxy-1,2-dihydrophenyl)acetyl-CoA isomerase